MRLFNEPIRQLVTNTQVLQAGISGVVVSACGIAISYVRESCTAPGFRHIRDIAGLHPPSVVNIHRDVVVSRTQRRERPCQDSAKIVEPYPTRKRDQKV